MVELRAEISGLQRHMGYWGDRTSTEITMRQWGVHSFRDVIVFPGCFTEKVAFEVE